MRAVWSSIRAAAAKVRSFLRAIYSLFRHGETTLSTYELRRAECMDCSARIPKPRGVYCGACGCPQWFMSDLRTKWRMLAVKCPLGKW